MTRQQAQLLKFIDGYQRQTGGVSPTYAEMATALELKSKSGIHRLLSRLEQMNQIKRDPRCARAIRVLAPVDVVADLRAAAARVVEEQGPSFAYAALRDIVAGLLPKLPKAA